MKLVGRGFDTTASTKAVQQPVRHGAAKKRPRLAHGGTASAGAQGFDGQIESLWTCRAAWPTYRTRRLKMPNPRAVRLSA